MRERRRRKGAEILPGEDHTLNAEKRMAEKYIRFDNQH